MIDINKIIKIIVILCFKLFLCISVIAGLISLYKWYTYERHINKIEVKAEFDSNVCDDKDYPLAITIFNKSSKTIEYSTIDVKVSYIGYSNKLNYGYFETDRIIESGTGIRNCWKVRSDSSYSYNPVFLTGDGKTAKVTYNSFKLKDE